MAEENYKKINELAHAIVNKCGESRHSYFKACPYETGEIFTLLLKRYGSEFMDKSTCAETAFYKAFKESMEKYDPNVGDFMPFFKTTFESRKKDELRKPQNKTSKNKSLDQPIAENDENNQVLLVDTIEDKINIAEIEESHSKVESFYQGFATICIERKKNYNGKKRVCYPPLFFTDKLVFQIFDGQTEMWFNDIVKRNSNKFDEAVVNEFLNTLVTGMCHSVTDIKKYGCKPLSEFTGKQEDTEKPCCGEKPNYHVFNSFLKKYYKDNDITPSAFTNQKKELAKMLKDIEKELRCD